MKTKASAAYRQATAEAEGGTQFPEIFTKYGMFSEPDEARTAKGRLIDRQLKAIDIVMNKGKEKPGAWLLMPILMLEAKAAEVLWQVAEKESNTAKAAKAGKKAARAA